MTIAHKPAANQKSAKPRIAERNEALAKQNIITKLGFLQLHLKAAAEAKHLSTIDNEGVHATAVQRALPTSIRQFNAFSTQELPMDVRDRAPSMMRNANDTLSRHRELRASVMDAVDAWERHLKARSSAVSASDSLAKMRRIVAFNQTVRKIAERELLAAREQVGSLTAELLQVQRALGALQRQATLEAEKHRDLEIQLRKLEQDRALPSKVFTIR